MEKIVKTPDSWNEINISTFQELRSVNDGDNKMFEIVSILIDEDPEEIKKWDLASFKRVSDALTWTNTLPTKEDFKKVIEIDGVKYGFVERLSSLNLGQWMDIETYLRDTIVNLHKLMAIFYRPIISERPIIIEPYDSVSGAKRAELFKYKLSIAECYGALVFFSTIERESLLNSQAYSLKQMRLMMMETSQLQADWIDGDTITSSNQLQRETSPSSMMY